jgi:hypothetical protein
MARTGDSGARGASEVGGRPVWRRESGLRARLRSLVGHLGSDPDFLVLGTQRGGTTSLFGWLDAHPGVRMARPKEVHYFDVQHARGRGWYRSHFPRARRGELLGEATPYYLVHPRVPARVRDELPEARLVVCLRDPVARAHSQFRHERALGFEPEPDFARALDLEPGRLAGEEERLARDGAHESYAHNHHGYALRGRYAEQLERWYAHFPREQIHVLFSEELFEEPGRTLGALAGFLGLDGVGEVPLARANAAPGDPLAPELRRRLEREFEEPDAALEALLGRSLPWRRA